MIERHAGAHIAGLILAAGQSERMGTDNKLLIPFHGKPVLQHTLDAACMSTLAETYVVTGHNHQQVEALLTSCAVTPLYNPNYIAGMASSIVMGVKHAQQKNADGVLVLLGDMPFITTEHIDHILTHYRDSTSICAPYANNKRGNPILWGRAYFTQLMALNGDQGARHLLRAHKETLIKVEMDMHDNAEAIFYDVDTKADLTLSKK